MKRAYALVVGIPYYADKLAADMGLMVDDIIAVVKDKDGITRQTLCVVVDQHYEGGAIDKRVQGWYDLNSGNTTRVYNEGELVQFGDEDTSWPSDFLPFDQNFGTVEHDGR